MGGLLAGSLGGALGGAITGHVLQLQNGYLTGKHAVLFAVYWAIGGGLGSGLSFAFFSYEYTTAFYAMTGAVVGFFVALIGGGLMLGTLAGVQRRDER